MANITDICSAVNQALASNPTMIYGPVAETVAQTNPWTTVLPTGTLPANLATQLYSVAQVMPYMGLNMGAPTANNMTDIVGACSANTMTSGSQSYQYRPLLNQFISTQIPLSLGFDAVESTLAATVETYATGIADYIAADNQYQILTHAGVMVVSQANVNPASMVTGGYGSYATGIPTTQATGGLDWNLVNYVARYQREFNRVLTFNGNLTLIAGYDAIESIRTQLGGTAGQPVVAYNPIPLGQLAAGGNKTATDALLQYAMEVTLRGVNLVKNPRPIRANYISGAYSIVNPIKTTTPTTGTGAIPNPDWNNAAYEVAFLVGKNAFRRLQPESYTGEDKVRYARQFFNGDIQFYTQNLNGNIFNNVGVLGAQVARAFQPVYPWHIAAIFFKRCLDPQVSTCTGISALG